MVVVGRVRRGVVVVDFGFGFGLLVLDLLVGSGSGVARDLMSVAGCDRSFLVLVIATEVVAILPFAPPPMMTMTA